MRWMVIVLTVLLHGMGGCSDEDEPSATTSSAPTTIASTTSSPASGPGNATIAPAAVFATSGHPER